jgi:O-antigen ligase
MLISEKKLEKILFVFWLLFFFLEFNLQIFSWRESCIFCKSLVNFLYNLVIIFFFCFLILILLAVLPFSDKERKNFLTILFVFILYMFISSFWSIAPRFSILGTFQILIFSLPMTMITLSFKYPKSILKKLAILFAIFGSLTSLFSLFLVLFGKIKDLGGGFYFQFFNFGTFQISQLISINFPFFSIYSVFHNPNTFGFWLFITICFTFFLLLEYKRLTIFLLAFIQILALFLTFSRASLLSLFGFLVCFLIFLRKKGGLKFFLLFCLIFFIILFSTFEGWRGKMKAGLGKRWETWKVAFQTLEEKPFLGTGQATSEILVKNKTGDIHFHNSFIEVLVELGILGFLFYLFLWIYPIKIGFKKLKGLAKKDDFIYSAFILSLLFGFFLNALFESRIFYSGGFLFTPLWFSFVSFLVNPNFPKSTDKV